MNERKTSNTPEVTNCQIVADSLSSSLKKLEKTLDSKISLSDAEVVVSKHITTMEKKNNAIIDTLHSTIENTRTELQHAMHSKADTTQVEQWIKEQTIAMKHINSLETSNAEMAATLRVYQRYLLLVATVLVLLLANGMLSLFSANGLQQSNGFSLHKASVLVKVPSFVSVIPDSQTVATMFNAICSQEGHCPHNYFAAYDNSQSTQATLTLLLFASSFRIKEDPEIMDEIHKAMSKFEKVMILFVRDNEFTKDVHVNIQFQKVYKDLEKSVESEYHKRVYVREIIWQPEEHRFHKTDAFISQLLT